MSLVEVFEKGEFSILAGGIITKCSEASVGDQFQRRASTLDEELGVRKIQTWLACSN